MNGINRARATWEWRHGPTFLLNKENFWQKKASGVLKGFYNLFRSIYRFLFTFVRLLCSVFNGKQDSIVVVHPC